MIYKYDKEKHCYQSKVKKDCSSLKNGFHYKKSDDGDTTIILKLWKFALYRRKTFKYDSSIWNFFILSKEQVPQWMQKHEKTSSWMVPKKQINLNTVWCTAQ